MIRIVISAFAICCASACFAAEPAMKLAYSQDFSKPDAIDEFVMTDAKAWRLGKDGDRSFLEQHAASKYTPPHRSPFNFALIGKKRFGDFVLEAELQSTAREYGHRDMVIVFGYQEPAKFYYVHIATQADDHANNVFIVKDAPRVKIAKETNKGNDWGKDSWRKVRIDRTLKDGGIKVFFNDLTKPIMVAEDKSFAAGWIGFGTFDDTGRIANIKVWSDDAEEKSPPPFKK